MDQSESHAENKDWRLNGLRMRGLTVIGQTKVGHADSVWIEAVLCLVVRDGTGWCFNAINGTSGQVWCGVTLSDCNAISCAAVRGDTEVFRVVIGGNDDTRSFAVVRRIVAWCESVRCGAGGDGWCAAIRDIEGGSEWCWVLQYDAECSRDGAVWCEVIRRGVVVGECGGVVWRYGGRC